MVKNVLITGATGGIGLDLSESFYKKGYSVILLGRNNKKLKEVCNLISEKITYYQCDLRDEKEINSVSTKIINDIGTIDILVNNAGVTDDSLFIRMGIEKWKAVIDTNLNANFILTNSLIKPMIKSRWGRIINITSIVCHTGNPGQSNYCASKAGIVGMSKSLAHEVAKRGITVNCISPGFIETKMTGVLSEEIKNNILKKIPMGRIGKAKDISDLALYLSSEKSSYITGQTFHVNGGMSMF
mgnify:CR=1 FL=1